MNVLERDICRIVCEVGLAAANHGFFAQAETIRNALPHLVEALTDRRILEATLLIGLGQTHQAMKLLVADASDEANTLRCLIESSTHTPRTVAQQPSVTHPQLA
ncbi:EscG/YscG/SsaH family type III secretion system needle protein co-chaperone [Pseudomonas sp. TH31]|uniref:EscG/YscG/SsaH family type III secretion system needle protein co-chaperone n=1 Tax=Pseudomonas sp. TH31 TaxID=2796396 RepID=UPI001914758E|nr:EscG/YscG/SsaH family type III secretion system needle protein co-chaperone [Pseudomonas sp. TH31]MBK5415409.1 EscG/YscG/SsaH family type III secretion system needle protein co-chaperone [Pseudomonas sp. TH31]